MSLTQKLVVPLLAAVGLWGSSAHASFPFQTCPTAPNYDLPIPTNIGATEFDPKPENPAGGASDGTKYHLNTDFSWSLYVNPNVIKIQPYYGFFQTEANYDYLQVDQQGGILKYSGNLNATTTPVAAGSTWVPYQGLGIINAVDLSWHSDYSVANALPPSFSQVAVQCRTSPLTEPVAPYSINIQRRVDGLLIKTGDVLYFEVFQLAGQPLVVSLDTKAATSGADFDLFASTTNQFPDNVDYMWRSYSSNPDEAMDIPAPASNRKVYISVHSFKGAGHFTLHALAMKSTERYALTVCPINFTPDATQQGQLRDFLTQGALRLLAATNGNLWIKTFNFTSSKSSCDPNTCSICLQTSGNTSYGNSNINPEGCGQISFGGGNWSGGAGVAWLFAHEAGHSCLGLPDEYLPPPAGSSTPMLCGHTIMSNHGYARFFCSKAHCKDGHSTDTTKCDPNSDNNWDKFTAGSHYHYGPNFSAAGTTADSTDYFGNEILRSMITVNF
jgi:hypothetical protein